MGLVPPAHTHTHTLTLLCQLGGAGEGGELDGLSEAAGQLHGRVHLGLGTHGPLGVLTDDVVFAGGLGEVDLGVGPPLALGLVDVELVGAVFDDAAVLVHDSEVGKSKGLFHFLFGCGERWERERERKREREWIRKREREREREGEGGTCRRTTVYMCPGCCLAINTYVHSWPHGGR